MTTDGATTVKLMHYTHRWRLQQQEQQIIRLKHYAVCSPLVVLQPNWRGEVFATEVTRVLQPVHTDHVSAVAGVVLQTLAANVTGEHLRV